MSYDFRNLNLISGVTGGQQLKVGGGGTYNTSGQAIAGPGLNWYSNETPGVLDASTDNIQSPQNFGNGEGSTGITSTSNPVSSGPSAEEIYKQQQISNISNKWGSYFGSLDNALGNLPNEAQLLKEAAGIQAGQQTSDLTASTDQSKADLVNQQNQAQTGQVRTLKDVSSNIRNLMDAANTKLGAFGAGDSSAVNQYGYAIAKMGSQARGDVMSQTRQIMDNINERLSKVNNVFTQEKNRIGSELSMQMNNISQWLVDQQNKIEEAKRQGQLDKSTDIQSLTDNLYNIAVQKATEYTNFYNDKYGALQEWALNNSNSIKEAQQKMAGYADFIAPKQQFAPISGNMQLGPSGGTASPYGGSNFQQFSEEEKRRLGMA